MKEFLRNVFSKNTGLKNLSYVSRRNRLSSLKKILWKNFCEIFSVKILF